MGIFAVTRSVADLERCREDLSAFLESRRRHNHASSVPETLLGILVDTVLVTDIPEALDFEGVANERRSVRILESTGLYGIWHLCWFEMTAEIQPLDRSTLLEALLAARPGSNAGTNFIPVFESGAGIGTIEMERLKSRHRDLLLAPLLQDSDSGRLFPPH